ncbi:MAG: N-acetylglucosamine kinase [Acutalibacteraceae bacterium]
MEYYLGIDGGGTRTVAAVSDEKGNILFKTEGKSMNFYSVGTEKARTNLSDIMENINNALGKTTFKGAFIGCSALDDIADEKTVYELCNGIIDAEKIRMNSDVFVALASSGEDLRRAVAICGTGSIVAGTDENNIIKTKGGWGHIIGDEGSAYSIALNSLKACAMLCDEGKNTPLVKAAEEFFGVDCFRDIIGKIHSPQMTKDVLAGFSEKVAQVAEDDFVAKTVIMNEAHFFSKTVLMLLNEIKKCTLLSLYGGVFQNNEFFRTCFVDDIREFYPQLKIELLTTPPEESALKIAREMF